jgi:hypothetical protein
MKRALLIAAAVGLIAPSGAAAATNSRVTIDDFTYAEPESTFVGQVFSPKKACKNHRKVTLFRKDSGPDQRIGADKTERTGDSYSWSIDFVLKEGGPYYAKIKTGDGCEGDRSKDYNLL